MPTGQWPLDAAWSVYAHRTAEATDYTNAYQHVCTVSTCEEWARLWNHLPSPSASVAVQGQTIGTWSWFHSGIRPEWEDPNNADGTTYVTITSGKHAWEALVVECVRGAAPEGLTGIQCKRVGARLKVSVWARAGAPSLSGWLQGATSCVFTVNKRK